MRKVTAISILLLNGYLIAAMIGSYLIWQDNYRSLVIDQHRQLDVFSNHIISRLEKYSPIPQLLSQNTLLLNTLSAPANAATVLKANQFLQRVNWVSQAADTYLLSKSGMTIAASNWQESNTFIGKRFDWRPYFKQARDGGKAEYFALGSTSGKRGYYFAYPVLQDNRVQGVVVVKMQLSAIESNWENQQSQFVATDPYGVIFMSSQPEWLYQSLRPLTKQEQQTLKESRQYSDRKISSLQLRGKLADSPSRGDTSRLISDDMDVIVSSKSVAGFNFDIRALSPSHLLYHGLGYFLTILTLIFAVILLISLVFYQRRQKQRQLEKMRESANQHLERQVLMRTSELQSEVGERERAEQALRLAQAELIQAAKLAVIGQLSATISHELNNPLAAIRSFADNGRKFLAREQWHRVDENLSRITALTERMADISKQLRAFARKPDDVKASQTDLRTVINEAASLIAAEAKRYQVDINLLLPSSPAFALVHALQLEQVIINLINNGIQAINEANTGSTGLLRVSLEASETCWHIHIDDNGPGIRVSDQEMLFEPFYTTRKNGLGLGLSLSQQLIVGMNGTLVVGQSPLDGARLTIRFEKDEDNA
ncbi:ATP-binding protein [Veronia pacifica]|uniref:C4-dicarboxylate transport sensor protein DctB n=1 Tax=Veronia pacifica TaxID=1080227 RepID=A0A1C3ESP2_9GAMM|nr:ATP-binding protein [Veronia pacifica]ODA36246.1 hypothetical protein A8L45_01205 [Veronia pacifica]